MRTLVRTTLAAAAVTLAAAGCGDSAPQRDGRSAATPDTPAPKSAVPESAAVRVEVLPISYAGLDRAIKEQHGKVVLVDVWSLT